MSSHPHLSPQSSRADWLLFLFSLLVGLLAISGGSLWIDEGNAAFKAIQPTFALFREAMVAVRGSDLQMPLYMAYLWEWEKTVGSSEWALRLANLPLWLLAQGALIATARRLSASAPTMAKVARVTVFLACCSPFLWQYLDEARPYIMQYTGAALLFAFLLELANDAASIFRTSTVWKGAAAVVLLSGASLLGVPWVATGGLISLWLLWSGRQRLSREALRQMDAGAILFGVVALAALAGLGVYYLIFLSEGGGASRQGNSALGLGFVVYEVAGFLGLGPGRLSLRGGDVAAEIKPFLPWLALGGLGIGLPLLIGAYQLLCGKARNLWEALPGWLLVFCLPLALTTVAGLLSGVRLLGRHMMPAMPLLLWIMAVLLVALWQGRRSLRWVAVLLPMAWLASAGLFRWSDKPQREDYRTAATRAAAMLQQGKPVIWAADALTGHYYGLPNGSAERFRVVVNPLEDALASERPALVILSRPDVYDDYGHLRKALETYGYQPQERPTGFTIYAPAGE